MENKNTNEKQEKYKNKLEYMRSVALDKEKCKQIAQKLIYYISSNKNN